MLGRGTQPEFGAFGGVRWVIGRPKTSDKAVKRSASDSRWVVSRLVAVCSVRAQGAEDRRTAGLAAESRQETGRRGIPEKPTGRRAAPRTPALWWGGLEVHADQAAARVVVESPAVDDLGRVAGQLEGFLLAAPGAERQRREQSVAEADVDDPVPGASARLLTVRTRWLASTRPAGSWSRRRHGASSPGSRARSAARRRMPFSWKQYPPVSRAMIRGATSSGSSGPP